MLPSRVYKHIPSSRHNLQFSLINCWCVRRGANARLGGGGESCFSCNCDVPWILALINIRYPMKVLWNIVGWRGSGDGCTLFYDDTFIRIKRIRYHDCTTYYITNPSEYYYKFWYINCIFLFYLPKRSLQLEFE